MEKINKNIMLSCIKHACFHVFSPFSAYFFPHDIIADYSDIVLSYKPLKLVCVWSVTL